MSFHTHTHTYIEREREKKKMSFHRVTDKNSRQKTEKEKWHRDLYVFWLKVPEEA